MKDTNIPLGKTLVAIATMSAVALMSAAPASAGTDEIVSGKYNDLSLTRYTSQYTFDGKTHSYTDQYAAAKNITEANSALRGKAAHHFTVADVAGIQKIEGFDKFSVEDKYYDYWSAGIGAWVNIENGGTATWTDAAISVSADAFASDQFETLGIQVGQGELVFDGESTNISVMNQAYAGETAMGEDEHSAAGVVFDNLHQDAMQAGKRRMVYFTADQTTINVESKGPNAESYGIWSVANDVTTAGIEFSGKAALTITSPNNAFGVVLTQNDTDESRKAENPILSPDDSGFVAFKGTSSAITATGSSALGVRADVGTFQSVGDMTITAAATDENGHAVGAAAIGYGKLEFTGSTTITAKGGTLNEALLLTRDVDGKDGLLEKLEEYVNAKPGTPTAIFSGKKTTLNGDVYVGEGALLQLAGNVTVNGGFKSESLITGVDGKYADLTVIGESVSLGEAAQPEYVNIASEGGSHRADVHVNSLTLKTSGDSTSFIQGYIVADDTITLDGGKFINNHQKNVGAVGDFHSGFITSKFVLENGAVLDNFGDLQARYIKIASGAEYHEADDEFALTEDGKGLVFAWGDDTLELAGGRLTNIGDGSLTDEEENPIVIDRGLDLRVIALQAETTGSSVSRKDARLVVSAGDYKFDDVTLDLEKGAVDVTGGSLTAAEFNAKQGTLGISGGNFRADTFNAIGTMSANAKGGLFSVGTYEGKAGSAFTLKSGEMKVSLLNLAKGAKLAVENSTLSTTTDQVFSKSVMGDKGDGKYLALEGLTGRDGLTFANGSLALNDEFYNILYAGQAEKVYKGAKLVWNGKQVDVSGPIDIEKIPEGGSSIHSNIDVKVEAAKDGSVKVEKNFGASAIVVGDGTGTEAAVDISKNVTLVGSAEAGKELIQGAKEVTVTGSLELGNAASSNNQGKISVAVTVEKDASFKVNDGSFHLADVTASSKGTIEVKKGDVTIGSLTIDGGTLSVQDGNVSVTEGLNLKSSGVLDLSKTAVKVGQLVVEAATGAVHTVTGALSADELSVAEGAKAVFNIGTTDTEAEDGTKEKGKAGALVLASKDTSIRGLTFFLDPVWEDGDEVTDASRLIVNTTNVNGQIVVGNNSYVVLGTDSDAAFTSLFGEDGSLQWGNGHTLAAAYVANPITVTAQGALIVQDSLTSLADAGTIAGGTVTFGENALLVADLTNADERAFISAEDSVSVASSAKAVLIGSIRNGVAYRLTSGEDENSTFGADQVVGGNPLWNFSANQDGTWTAQLQDAGEIFGNLMQGTELANAGMQSSDEWVNSLLTDETGDFSNPGSAAQLFDAAMNPAGALASFTTAYDRSSDMRRAVRAEAQSGEAPRLWAQITGGKTKLKGLSTGGVDLHTKTDAYGVIVGAEGSLSDFTVGGALSVGTGKTKNNAVSAKDDFDWYGFSVYGRTTVGGVDVLADASATFLKSDLTVGGKAAVDTDTTTAVWSIGAQVQKTFDVGVDLTPFIGMDIYHVRADGYSNGHGASVQDADATAVEFPIGATVAKTFEASCGAKIAPTFTLAVVPTVGDRDIDSKVKFAGAESTYNFTFADDVKVRANLGVNASKGNFSFGLSTGYEWGSEERSSTNLMLRTSYAF